MNHRALCLLSLLAVASVSFAQPIAKKWGHSTHASAFDSGLRQRPWVMEGIGKVHLPITTKVPEVQKWFDQGMALLHSFWWEEAERSFRWCVKLDPDCAMAYWALAYTYTNSREPNSDKRSKEMAKMAMSRRSQVTEREQMYIDFIAEAAQDKAIEKLQALVLKFPNEIEAKAILAYVAMDRSLPFTNELLIRDVLARDSRHPGAHHYRIHTWDGRDDLQALASCRIYGSLAPNIGHADHMPGHIYSKIGMWNEAAIAMDTATRIELKYMNDRLALPFETWNFAHNRNYLCFIQEQLGMAEHAISGARTLLATPGDPDRNETFGLHSEGLMALVRALIKFERWDQVLAKGGVPWTGNKFEAGLKLSVEAIAYAGSGQVAKARQNLDDLKKQASAKDAPFEIKFAWEEMGAKLEAIVLAAEGKNEDAAKKFKEASAAEAKKIADRQYGNDPTGDPLLASRIQGDFLLSQKQYKDAIACYELALKQLPGDAFSLSGLARAHFALGDKAAAQKAAAGLAYVWRGADPNLKWLAEVNSLGLKVSPALDLPERERRYLPTNLDKIGTADWAPFAAPKLEVTTPEGKRATLDTYKGKNIVLVYYLSDECVHCVEQLVSMNKRMAEFRAVDTVVLAVSAATPEQLKATTKLGGLDIILLSDKDHANARRWASYDDFEELELHSTILIDKQGRIRWKRTGGEPFTKIDFLLREIGRFN